MGQEKMGLSQLWNGNALRRLEGSNEQGMTMCLATLLAQLAGSLGGVGGWGGRW